MTFKWFLKRYVLGYLAYYLSRLLRMTLRVRVIRCPEYDSEKTYLFAFWHGKQWLPVVELPRHKGRRAVLVSASNDGNVLALWLKQMGYEVIRGSSRHQNISALTGMIRKLKQGCSLGFGIDGPLGPIYKVKPGMTHLSQKFQIPILPIGSAFERYWRFEKAWDKYEIPKPFSKAVFYIGKPICVEKGVDLTVANEQLEQCIKTAELAAKNHLG